MDKKKFYITTAIAYTSRKPHIGNAYDIVLADMIARYKRMCGFDVYFLTGSDEHGQKIEECAKCAGITPKQYVDNISDEIKSVWNSLNTSYDKFIRTTDDYHEKTIQKIFKKLYEQGDIYKGTYNGKYCVPCESFFTSSQLVDGKCPDCGRDVIDAKEEAYFLKLSKYQDKLEQYFNDNPDFIQPQSRKNEMINNFIKPGLADLCVSRSTFKWGIPVDFDPDHVVYVWIDALSNYITGIGFDCGENCEKFEKYWPADLHVIGKDIVRFHTIYWPIILMALGLPLPKQVLGHPWVLVGEDKMSKSKGNVIYADYLANKFSADAVRYYLLSEMPFAQDGTITYESFINKYNTDLANTFGNLVNRTVAMANIYFGGSVKRSEETTDIDNDLLTFAEKSVKDYTEAMEKYHNADACAAILNLAKRCNKYIDETTPWSLAKDESSLPRLNAVLYNLLDCIRLIAVMLRPIMPDFSDSVFSQLNCNDTALETCKTASYSVSEATPLFARIDTEKMLAEIADETSADDKQDNVVRSRLLSGNNSKKPEITAIFGRIVICDKLSALKAKEIRSRFRRQDYHVCGWRGSLRIRQ